MELKLNFKVGQKTVNNRYYDPDMLIKQFTDYIEENKSIPVGPDSKEIESDNGVVPPDKLVGSCTGFRIDEDGTMFLEVSEMSEATETYLKNNPDIVKLSIFGFGTMDENKVVREFKLTSLFMTMDG
jgi:hypothetical protein